MKLASSFIIFLLLAVACNQWYDPASEFSANVSAFKKLEDPPKKNERFIFESPVQKKDAERFDSLYLLRLNAVFKTTSFNFAYIYDGDLLMGYNGSLTLLLFSAKRSDERVQLLNFGGTLQYLLQNGQKEEPPYAKEIAPGWYLVRDIQLL